MLPSGIVAFLFTDVEGSTRLWGEFGDAMKATMRRHDAILRSTLERHEGYVFTTAGDSFAAAFADPGTAVLAATEIQRLLGSEEWGPVGSVPVRIGLHVGVADERDGDFFGPAVNRAARIMEAGHGGQILVSDAIAGLVRDADLGEIELVDVGVHELRGVQEPERIFQVTTSGLEKVFPPLRTADVAADPKHNLPESLTSFVDHTDTLVQVHSLVDSHRLVVLTGTGGAGKTRLAIETAREAATEFADGAWLVELAPVENPVFVMTEIGDTWGLRAGKSATIEEVITRFLKPKRLLVVVDNCEHVLDAADAAIRHLLRSGVGVSVVATSRESLGIDGEIVFRVPSMSVPDDPAHVADAEAVQLFVDRAQAVRPGFAPDPGQLATIGRIVARIDGIPLGIELAAARLRSMTVDELAGRLEESFRILSRTAKGGSLRQRTLDATLDWSHQLLTSDEQAMFARLSVFSGGFEPTAAAAVCVRHEAGDGLDDWVIDDLLDSLIDKSLVIRTQTEWGSRYRMLEPVRQYARQRLIASGQSDVVEVAHARHYAEFVAEASPYLRGPEQLPWRRRLEADYDNIRTALNTLLDTGAIDTYLDATFDLAMLWWHLGSLAEALDLTLAGLDAAPATTNPLRLIKAWWTAAWHGMWLGQTEAIDYARSGLAIADTTGDPNTIGRMRLMLGHALLYSGDLDRLTLDLEEYRTQSDHGWALLTTHPERYWWEPHWDQGLQNYLYLWQYQDQRLVELFDEVSALLDETIDIFDQTGDKVMLGGALVISWMMGDDDWVTDNLARAIEVLEQADAVTMRALALSALGEVLRRVDGRLDESETRLFQAAELLGRVGDRWRWSSAMRWLATSEAKNGKPEQACTHIADVIEAMPDDDATKRHVILDAAEVLAAAGRLDKAAMALGAATILEFWDPFGYGEERFQNTHERLEGRLHADELQRYMTQGAAMTTNDALAHLHTWLTD